MTIFNHILIYIFNKHLRREIQLIIYIKHIKITQTYI